MSGDYGPKGASIPVPDVAKAFAKMRRKLASWVLGDQLALYMPARYCEAAEADVLAIPDAELAALTRHWFCQISQANGAMAAEEEKTLASFMAMHSALSIIRMAHEANATEYRATVTSATVKGADIGDWIVTATLSTPTPGNDGASLSKPK